MYKVVIIEDDPMVSDINRRYVELGGTLSVVGIFRNGRDAWDYLSANPADLILLDINMPEMDGEAFLQKLRSEGCLQDVILVTAVNDPRRIARMYALGILDYLLKPYVQARFQTALYRFLARREALEGEGAVNQAALDRCFSEAPAAENHRHYMDKGIQSATLELICTHLRKHRNEELTVDMLAQSLSLSCVTLRRYMNYLISHNSVLSSVDYNTGGRPSAVYTYVGK